MEWPCKNGHNGCPAYRAMTETEKNDKYWSIHGESKHHNAWGPSNVYRETENRYLKTHNKREIQKYKKLGDEYDPMFIANFKKTAYWAWC